MPHNGRSQGRKKSNFPAQTSVLSGATFDYVANGTNFKITFSDLLTALGATGTIVQDGAVTGTPILDTQGTVNNIRNLENGSGILATVSPENGVTLKHNFSFNQVGAPLTPDSTAASPVLKSLLAGTGVQLTQSDETITIEATGSVAPTSRIVINVEADFPVQDATTITLQAGIVHEISANITTAKRFIVLDGSKITMGNTLAQILTYTGTGDMFTGVDAGFSVFETKLDSPNANQTFNITSTSPGTFVFITQFISLLSSPKFGTFTNLAAIDMVDSSGINCDDGITLIGTFPAVIISAFLFTSTEASFVGVDLGASIIGNPDFNSFEFVAPAGATGFKGLAASGNVPTGSKGNITGCSFTPGMIELDTLTADDIRWVFAGNTGIPDTHPDARISLVGNATATAISAANTPVVVSGPWTVRGQSHFTGTSGGRITYDGEDVFTAPLSISLDVSGVSGGTKNITAYLVSNGVIDADTPRLRMSPSSSQPDSVTLVSQRPFNTGEFVELWIENNSDAVDVIVVNSENLVN